MPCELDVSRGWQTDDFWQYALYAAVAFIRAVADRAGVPASQVGRELARSNPDPA